MRFVGQLAVMNKPDEHPEMKKIGQALIGFAILAVVVFLRWQCVKEDAPPPVVHRDATPDMSAPVIDPEALREAMAHMKRSIEAAAAEERRQERKKKRRADHPKIPGMEYLGTTNPDGRFIPAD